MSWHPQARIIERMGRFLVCVAIIVLAVFGLEMHALAYRQYAANPRGICGADFPIFYESAKLIGSPTLYSPDHVQRAVYQQMGCAPRAAAFIRLPYFAVLLWPLTLVPLHAAFAVWRIALIAAILGFIALQREQWLWALLACSWSSALAWDIENGEDVSLLLLLIALAAIFQKRNKPLWAGLCFGLCAAKFHLMLLIPVLLLARKSKQTLKVLAAVGLAIMIVSFLAQGWNWPRDYARALLNPNIDPVPGGMWNLRGLAGGHLPLEIILGLTVVAAVWVVGRRASFEVGLAAALSGGILISHHITPSDWALLVPAALALGRAASWPFRIVSAALVSPLVTYVHLGSVVPFALLGLVYGLALGSIFRGRQSPTSANSILDSVPDHSLPTAIASS